MENEEKPEEVSTSEGKAKIEGSLASSSEEGDELISLEKESNELSKLDLIKEKISPLIEKFQIISRKFKFLFFPFIWIFRLFKKNFADVSADIFKWVKNNTVGLFFETKKYWKDFRYLKKGQKLMIALLPVILIPILWLAKVTLTGEIEPKESYVLVASLMDVADQVFEFNSKTELEGFYDSFRYPENIILLDKIYINLKHSRNSTRNPMGAFEVYIIGNSEKVMIEIKSRERELRDVVSRSLEEMNYKAMTSPEGKRLAKRVLKIELNQTLTTGKVQRVFFKSVSIKR